MIISTINFVLFIMIVDNQQEKDTSNQGQKGLTKKRLQNKQQEEEIIGPNPRKLLKIQFHDLLLESLPTSQLYEISYMHRDIINNIISSYKTDFIITFSVDGHIKFWKKAYHLVEFTKNFKAHNGLITGASLSRNHDLLCSVGLDKTFKIFDVLNCDLKTAVKLNFSPGCCQFIPQEGREWELIAVSEEKTGKIWIIDPQCREEKGKIDDGEEIITVKIDKEVGQNKEVLPQEHSNIIDTVSFHRHPIKFIKMNWQLGVCLSLDERGFLQIWDPNSLDFPTFLSYKCKSETNLLQLIQANSPPLSLSISPKGTYAAVVLRDKTIYIFNLRTGKLIHKISEGIKDIMKIQQDPTHPNHADYFYDEHEYERKLNIEKDIQISKDYLFNPNVEFDETEEFLIYTSFHGIKFFSLTNKCVQRVIGKKEAERFVRISLFQGRSMRNPNGNANIYGQRKATDPVIICSVFRKPRFYIFSRRSPQIEGENAVARDIINQRQPEKENQAINQLKLTQKQNQVVLQTTMGDIHLLLYLEDCPKTCENFIKLVKKSYYNGMIFHRVIKGFMNQTGCPKGDGTGGESIWGGNFEDQLRPQKHRFDKPYVLAMANRGPNTNGSQFFLTVIACPWLDNKHTIFGRVIKGIETVCDINKLKTDKGQKPILTVKILNAKVC